MKFVLQNKQKLIVENAAREHLSDLTNLVHGHIPAQKNFSEPLQRQLHNYTST